MAMRMIDGESAASVQRRPLAAVLGGGVIGGGWAARFLLMGWDVAVFDPDPEAPRKIGEVLENARRALPSLLDVAAPAEGRLWFAGSIAEAVAQADWIQESAPERLELKLRLYAEVQSACRPDAVIGSSTSGFKPSELQTDAADPTQILVVHPFNPVYLVPLVEVVGSDATSLERVERAKTVLSGLGMLPLHVRQEIDAHIADRLLEAVWREGLWLIHDGVATTQEIDDAIRFGFGLRWAQMGLFETYRIAGGEAGMRHFIGQFAPALKWPWTKLTDVPELSDALVETIAAQSDAQSGEHSIRELERIRDDNLVAMMRALKTRDWGAGALLNQLDVQLSETEAGPGGSVDLSAPLPTGARRIPLDWAARDGGVRDSRIAEIFEDAAGAAIGLLGAASADGAVARFQIVESRMRRAAPIRPNDPVAVSTRVKSRRGAKLKLVHALRRADDGALLAEAEQTLANLCPDGVEARPPARAVARRLSEAARAHAALEPVGGQSRGRGAQRSDRQDMPPSSLAASPFGASRRA